MIVSDPRDGQELEIVIRILGGDLILIFGIVAEDADGETKGVLRYSPKAVECLALPLERARALGNLLIEKAAEAQEQLKLAPPCPICAQPMEGGVPEKIDEEEGPVPIWRCPFAHEHSPEDGGH
jgi:hypothetical protein